MYVINKILIGVFFTLLALLGPAAAQSVPTGKLPANVTPTHYQLDFKIFPATDRFSGQAHIAITLLNPSNILWLHGQSLQISNAQVETNSGEHIAATYTEVGDSGIAKLELQRELKAGPATIIISFSAPFNQSLEGLYQVKRQRRSYAYTHFEPLRARRAFPAFDEPRFKTPFDISVTVSGNDIAVSNAPAKEIIELEDNRRRYIFNTTKPLPTYLVAIAVGDFDVVEWPPIPPNAVRSRPIPLRGIAPKGKGSQLRYALKHTEALLTILEDYFATPYPYAKLDLVVPEAFNSGGMENAGAIFYRQDKILLGDNPSIHQLRSFAYIHAHELAHNWFGNLVTPAWWDDLWLNEAFATWMSSRVVNSWQPERFDDRGPIRNANWAMWSDRLVSARKIHQPITSNHDITNAFDSITYSKGGGVLSMIEQFMGPEKFRDGIRQFVASNKHGVVTSRDFFTALSDVAADPAILRAFRSFLDQPGTPHVAVDWTCTDSGHTEIRLEQSRSLPLGSKGNANRLWSLPICLVFPNGGTRAEHCLLLEERQATVQLKTKSCPAWIMPNGAGAAYANFSLSDAGWQALINNMDQIKPGEVLSTIKSAQAAYEAGLIKTGRLLSAAAVAARSPHWDVAKSPIQALRDIKNFVLPKGHLSEFKTLMQELYRPALQRFDLSDTALATEVQDSDKALLRAHIFWFLALDAGHQDLRTRLGRLAQAYMGFGTDGAINREKLHPNLLRAALIVAAQDVGMPFVEMLIERLRSSDDATLREHIIRTLGYQTDREMVQRVQNLVLEPQTRKRDASQLLRRQGHMVANRDKVFDWMVANYDVLLKKLPRSSRAWLVWRTSAFCDLASRNRIKAFFAERSNLHRGGPKALANVLEAVEICAAVVKHQRQGAINALAAFK